MSDDIVQKIDTAPNFQKLGQWFHETAQKVGDFVFKDNPLIRWLDSMTQAAWESEAKGINLGGDKLAGGLNEAPALPPSKTPVVAKDGPSLQLEKKMGHERMKEVQVAALGDGGKSMGMNCCHVSNADLCNLCPSSFSVGPVQGQARTI